MLGRLVVRGRRLPQPLHRLASSTSTQSPASNPTQAPAPASIQAPASTSYQVPASTSSYQPANPKTSSTSSYRPAGPQTAAADLQDTAGARVPGFGWSQLYSPEAPATTSPRTTVYYDGKCGLCSREIDHYRRVAPPHVFHWRDVTEHHGELEAQGVSLEAGLRLLHARDAGGTLHVGVDAFILIWSQLDRWRLLATLVSLPIVKGLATALYTTFADRRFRGLEHCQLAARRKE